MQSALRDPLHSGGRGPETEGGRAPIREPQNLHAVPGMCGARHRGGGGWGKTDAAWSSVWYLRAEPPLRGTSCWVVEYILLDSFWELFVAESIEPRCILPPFTFPFFFEPELLALHSARGGGWIATEPNGGGESL